MKTKFKYLALTSLVAGVTTQLIAQGYIVPNGVLTNYNRAAIPREISVIHDPVHLTYTGFAFDPIGTLPPSVYPNIFSFDYILDVGVRVFKVSLNAPITEQAILSGSYTEFSYPNSYVFNSGIPFYVGLYTGNMANYPPSGIYSDPLFGWAKLVNNQGVIQLLDSAIEYQGGGIYAGTQTIIPVPEPSSVTLLGIGTMLLSFFGRRNSPQ